MGSKVLALFLLAFFSFMPLAASTHQTKTVFPDVDKEYPLILAVLQGDKTLYGFEMVSGKISFLQAKTGTELVIYGKYPQAMFGIGYRTASFVVNGFWRSRNTYMPVLFFPDKESHQKFIRQFGGEYKLPPLDVD